MPARLMLPFLSPNSSPDPETPETGGRLVATDGRALPLRSTELAAEAGGGIARVVLTQRFVNPHSEPLTVEYLLPLPSDAAVSGFSFILGERRVVGEVDRKAEARARFEQALSEGRSAALLEQSRDSVFAQTIGNVPPGAEIIAEVIVDQPLRWLDEGAWEWRFPTVVSPRYMGATGRVADAAALAVDVAVPGTGAVATLSLVVADALTGAPESSSHPLDQQLEASDGRTNVRFRGDRGVALDRDVVVRWPVAQPRVGASLIAARPAAAAHGGDTFALVSVTPPLASAGMRPIPRDIIFLLDTSGSMAGRPLTQAKRVVSAMIDTLGDEDRIELIEFGSTAKRFRAEPLAATRDGKHAAKQWLDKLRASGGTEMHEAVLEAIRPLRNDGQRQVVLVTDGQIGFEEEIITALLTSLPAAARLHTVGIGSAVNRSLTRAAARAGRGSELIVDLDEDVERVIPHLLARTSAPLVTDLRIEGDAGIVVAPRALPDLYAGSPALIAVRVHGPSELWVRGRGIEGAFEQRVAVPELALGQGLQGVAALFGREMVEDLETLGLQRERRSEVDVNVEALGLAFQIATRKTSWVAITSDRTVDPELARRVRQPHELPHGTSIEGLGLRDVGWVNNRTGAGLLLQTQAGPTMTGRFEEAKFKRAHVVEARRSNASLVWLFFLLLLLLVLPFIVKRCASSNDAQPNSTSEQPAGD
jgi:Ca-activated chloride channel family protein